MSLQYLADFESEVTGSGDGTYDDLLGDEVAWESIVDHSEELTEIDEVFVTHWIEQGLVLAGTMDGRLRGWHAKDGIPVGSADPSAHRIGVTAISSSAMNKTALTSAMDGTVALWDTSGVADHVATMSQSDSLEATDPPRGEEAVWPLEMLGQFVLGAGPKGQNDASVSETRTVVRNSKVAITTLLHPVLPLFAATGLEGILLLYDLAIDDGRATCQVRAKLWPGGVDGRPPVASETKAGQRDCGLALAFSASGDVVAVGTQKGRVHLFEVGKKRWLDTIPIEKAAIRALCFLPGGELLVGSDDGTVHVYDVRAAAVTDDTHMITDEDLGTYGDEFDDDDDAEDFSSSQHSPYTQGWNTSTQQSSSSMFSQTQGQGREPRRSAAEFVKMWLTGSPWLTDVRASPDGRIIATSSRDGTVRIWDFRGPPPLTALCTIPHNGEICTLSWKPLDGKANRAPTNGSVTAATQSAQTASTFVAGSSDGRVRWYRCAGGAASGVVV